MSTLDDLSTRIRQHYTKEWMPTRTELGELADQANVFQERYGFLIRYIELGENAKASTTTQSLVLSHQLWKLKTKPPINPGVVTTTHLSDIGFKAEKVSPITDTIEDRPRIMHEPPTVGNRPYTHTPLRPEVRNPVEEIPTDQSNDVIALLIALAAVASATGPIYDYQFKDMVKGMKGSYTIVPEQPARIVSMTPDTSTFGIHLDADIVSLIVDFTIRTWEALLKERGEAGLR